MSYVAYLLLRRRLPGPTRLDWPLAALVLVFAAASATSVAPRVSFEACLLIAAVLLVFYALHDFDFLDTAALVRGITALGAVCAIFALYSAGETYVDWLELVRVIEGGVAFSNLLPPTAPRVHGIGDHVNVLAMALNLTLPFALTLALRPAHASERWLGGATSVLVLAALFFTLSRGAWLGTAASMAVFVALYGLSRRDLAARLLRAGRALYAAGFASIAVVLLAGVLVALSWESRPEWLFRATLSPRQDAAAVALEIFRDRPWLGSGPHTFPLLYDTYSGAYPIENIHPHNGYLNDLVDVGIVGALVLGVTGLLLLRAMLQAYRAGDPARRIYLTACASALTSLAVHAFFDSPNPWQTALLPFAAVLALSLRLCLPPSAPTMFSRAPRVLLVALAPLLAGGLLFIDLAQADYDASLRALHEGRFADASTRALEAAEADPGLAAYHLHAGTTQAVEYLVARDNGEERPALLDASITSLRRAVADDTRSALAYMNLALALQHRGDGPGAVEAAHLALDRAPADAAIATAAGTVFEWAGRPDDALSAYARAFSYDSPLIQAEYWASRPDLASRALMQSTLTACEKGRLTALYGASGERQEMFAHDCRAYLDASPGDTLARAGYALILLMLGRPAEAAAEAEAAVRQVPDHPQARTAHALTLGSESDPPVTSDLLPRVRHELMIGAYLGDPDAAVLLAKTYKPDESFAARGIGVISEPGPMPAPLMDLLHAQLPASASMVVQDGVQRYLLGVLYYRIRYWRESPTSLLIPGDWMQVQSPRARAILDLLRDP